MEFRKELSRAVCAAILVLLLPMAAAAHDIPSDVTVQAFVKPDGHRLRVLVRVPLKALRDVQYPAFGPDGERRTMGAYLDLSQADAALRDAAMLWIGNALELYEGESRLPPPAIAAVQASLAYDTSFATWAGALAHVTSPRLPDTTRFAWADNLLDVLFEYPIRSDRSDFSIRPAVGRLGLRTNTVVRFVLPDGRVRAFDLAGDPGLVRLDPRWSQAALTFVRLGFGHILDGADHLLFLFCLVIPFRRLRGLVAVVTAFTVAHSITLIASAYNLAPDALWFPPLVETLIAASIVYMALENIVGASLHRRWLITFGFGLVHGFGFSFALRQTLQFAGSHLLTSLLAFNIGVELGQLLVLACFIPALALLFRYVVEERMGTIILSAFVAHTGWHWMTDRYGVLRQYSFAWPAITAASLLTAVRLAIVIVAATAVWWLVFGVLLPRRAADKADEEPAGIMP